MGSYNLTRYGEELLERTKKDPPSFTIHLHSDHFNLNASKKWSYTHPIACIFEDIRAHRIPVDFLELFNNGQVPFYDGCMIVELLDYRSQNKNEPVLERPEQKRMILHPNGETLWADICLLSAKPGRKWTDREVLEIEAGILLATAPPLCLDPDPHLTRIANNVLRVSTPTEPALLKRKADVVEPEERETEKAKRAKIMQFGNPRLNRPYAPSYRILDVLDRKTKGTMVTAPPPVAKPQPPRPPSRAPSQTPVPQPVTRPLTPSTHSSAHPSPTPVNASTPYNLPHSPAPPPTPATPVSQPPLPLPTEDPAKRLLTKTPLPPSTQTFTVSMHSTHATSATASAGPTVPATRGAQTPIPVPYVVTTGPGTSTPYPHLMPNPQHQPPVRRSVSPTKPHVRPSPSPAPGVNSHPQQTSGPMQATTQAHLYPSVQAATAAAQTATSPTSNVPVAVANSPANVVHNELSPAQATEPAKRAVTPLSAVQQQQRYSQSPRVVPAVMQQGSPTQGQIRGVAPGRSGSATPVPVPMPPQQQQPPLPGGHQNSPRTVPQSIPHPHPQQQPTSQHPNPQQQSNGFQPQFGLQQRTPNMGVQGRVSTPAPAATAAPGAQVQQQGATTAAVTGGTPTPNFIVKPNPSNLNPNLGSNPAQGSPTQTLQVPQQGQPQVTQAQRMFFQQHYANRMKLQQQRAGTPVNQGMMRGGNPAATQAQMQQLQQLQQMQQQQQHMSPQQQQQQMQQHASPRPAPSQAVVPSPITPTAQAAQVVQSQRTVTPGPGMMGPGGVGRGSPMIGVHNQQRIPAGSPMPTNANVNPTPAVNSLRMAPQQQFAHYQAHLARMRQQASGTPAPGGGGGDSVNPQRQQLPLQQQQQQVPPQAQSQGSPQHPSSGQSQNQGQNPSIQQQQQHAYQMFYAPTGMQGRLPQAYWPGVGVGVVPHQHAGMNPAAGMQGMAQNGQMGQMNQQQQQQMLYHYIMGRGRGFPQVPNQQQHQQQQQGRGGPGPGNMTGR